MTDVNDLVRERIERARFKAKLERRRRAELAAACRAHARRLRKQRYREGS
ncbi:hypothetical protein ABZ468_42885 [Streptomyces sp. NPDC005708]